MTAPGADPQARLAGTMVDVLVAELAEPGRLRRGRALAQQGAVVTLDVEPGLLVAAVQGSEREPYGVTVRVALVASPTPSARLTELVPHRRQLRFECSCPDDDIPCKHAVATMTRFAQRLAYEPALFLRWRTGADTGPASDRPRGTAASPPSTEEAPLRLAADARTALRALLGEPSTTAMAMPEVVPLPGPVDVWDEVWRSMLADALSTLRRGRVRPPAGSR